MAIGFGCEHGPDQKNGRSEVLASRADYHRFVSESLLHESGTSRSRVDSLPDLWSILMLNQCRSHIKIKFYIGSDAPAGHTRNCCRSVAEIMAPSKMRSINLAYRPGYDCMRRSRVRVIKLTGHRGDRDIRIALSSEAPLKGFARGYI
jgi:hypothetical protein